MADYAALDVALDALAGYGPDLANGLTNHAPMAAEALCSLGRGDAVAAWVDAYRPGLAPRPAIVSRIAREDWRGALGKTDRTSDWMDFFERQLGEGPWRDVVRRWARLLLPAHCASAAHGVIRTGHAVRALLHAESALRLRELAEALGYWAANYQVLPAARASAPAARHAREAIARVPRVPVAERRFAGTIVSSLEALDDFAPFAPVIDGLGIGAALEDTLSDLTEAFARVYLANARDVLGTIVFVHAVTGAAAIRPLLPLLDADAARDSVRFAWQTGAALYASFGSAPALEGEVEAPAADPASLVDDAIANGDEHAVKFTEVCVREHARRPAPAYLAAARHAIDMLPRAPRRVRPVAARATSAAAEPQR